MGTGAMADPLVTLSPAPGTETFVINICSVMTFSPLGLSFPISKVRGMSRVTSKPLSSPDLV